MNRAWAAVLCAAALALAPLATSEGPLAGGVASPERPTTRPAAAPLVPAVPARVTAPAIGLDAPVVPLGLDATGALALPPDAAVAGWYTGGPDPGALGPAVVAGHVDWHHRVGAFARIGALTPGDLVDVARLDGSVATFEVQTVRRVAKDRFPTAQVYGDLPGAGLRLVTCGGRFDPGTQGYVDNIVVWAALVGT
ncbi:class F sortase [Pseudonocardia dioxanivorans]|uniref:class F sortase n=1 Tax=Pseudonocardia dioxanivorans TaxID=240495 RepID=UPI00059FDAC2|nr:class F sortase [Pseudonocardia dioxanivorans]